jgi:uncharacterized repeat protein (TIGR01451 family)
VIEKTADAQSVDFGGSVAYAITVKHAPGSDPVAVPVQSVTDTLGTGPAVDLVLMSGDTNQNAKLDPDETWSYGTAEGPFTAHADACGPLVNTATLYAEGDVNPANDSSTATVAVKCALDVAILKGADKATYAPGDTITYTVTVTNTGQLPVPFSAIHVSDPTLPALSPVAPTPDVLAPGASQAYTGTRTVGKADCGQVKNTATVALTGDLQPESSTANNTASVTVTVDGALCNVIVGEPQTTLRITKVGPRTSQPRRAVPYRIRVTNSGSVLAKSVVLTDPIPSGMVLAKLPKGATLVKGKVRWSIGDLAPGQKVSFTVLLRSDVNANRTRCNIATAGAANARPVRGKACTTFVQIAGAGRLPVVTG